MANIDLLVPPGFTPTMELYNAVPPNGRAYPDDLSPAVTYAKGYPDSEL